MSPLHPLFWWELFKRHPLAVAQGFLTVFLAASNWYIYLDHTELEAALESESKTGAEVLDNVANSPLIRQQAVVIRGVLKSLDANLIVETDLAQNIGYFYSFEEKSGAKLSDLSQMLSSNPPDGSPYRSLPFTMRVTGEFPQILSMLHAIETGRYAAKISRFSFSRREDQSGLMDATLSVNVLAKP